MKTIGLLGVLAIVTTAIAGDATSSGPSASQPDRFGPPRRVTKIAYVVDVGAISDDMDFVKVELIRAINALRANQQFAVVFFSDSAVAELSIEGEAGFHRATAEHKRTAHVWVTAFKHPPSNGASDFKRAFELAFAVKGGPPELIYLLTAGEVPADARKAVADLNKDHRVKVNTIAFLNRKGEELLMRIAQENGGSYKFVAKEDMERATTQPAEPAATQPAATQPAAGVTFFKTKVAEAGKVCYLVDSSGSMFEWFGIVQAELIRSIAALGANQQFAVIFLRDGQAIPVSDRGKDARWMPATAENKKAAADWIRGQEARSGEGSADARYALTAAFKLAGAPPDIMFLLTDGVFPQATLDLLARLNKDRKVRIHTIAFIDRVGEELLQQIAKDNGGGYTFISEEDLDVLSKH